MSSMGKISPVPRRGPDAYDNWQAALNREPARVAFEFPFYSDARFTGDMSTGLGPYKFFNQVPLRCERGLIRVASVLRLDLHIRFDDPDLTKTDVGSYHGGTMVDELASLASLLTGARLRAGGESRIFDSQSDPAGRPIAWRSQEPPILSVNPHGIVLPSAEGDHSLMALEHLPLFLRLGREDAIALIRAARLYQDALWVVETEPNLAWIMLVSAVEGVANRWRVGNDKPLVRLSGAKPELVEFLQNANVGGLVERIASEFADSLGATAKFVDFLLEHLPIPPPIRPPNWAQVDWTLPALASAFRSIYGHRSKALHEGIPFPAPLCRTVVNPANRAVPSERPIELGASELGGVWTGKDLPLYLHTFEYITRESIVSWRKRSAA